MNHKQYDPLSVELYAGNVSLPPDLGYPVTWNYRYRFDSHSMAANTVTVSNFAGGNAYPAFSIDHSGRENRRGRRDGMDGTGRPFPHPGRLF